MKKILITGANSYIGVSVEKYLSGYPEQYQVETLNMIGVNLEEQDFSKYDVVFHVAGIAHRKETETNADLYYEINEKLAVRTAEKCKRDRVKQFVILSSMSVYGMESGHITKTTKPHPISHYGKSKYRADQRIAKLADKDFMVAILRPPMVYGKNCKGNYQTLRKFALKSPIFPSVDNKRSMIYVMNLAAFIKGIIDDKKSGLFFPQDAEYVCTADMVKKIAECNGKKVAITGIFNWGVYLALALKINVFKKVFGSLTYEKVDMVSEYGFTNAIKCTEE